jgi:hypothetical protein
VKTRDDGLILTEPRVSLANLPREGVSGSLSHQILNQQPRADHVGERTGAGARTADQCARAISDRGREAG